MFPREDSTSHDPTNVVRDTEKPHAASLKSPTQPKPVRLAHTPAGPSGSISSTTSAPHAPEVSVRLKWNRIQRSHFPTSLSRKPPLLHQPLPHEAPPTPASLPLLQDDALRAREASLVFTAEGGERRSPPLEGLFGSAKSDAGPEAGGAGGAAASRPVPSRAPAAGGEALWSPNRQAAEPLDLQICRRLFAAARQQGQQGAGQGQIQQPYVPHDAQGEKVGLNLGSSFVNSNRQSLCYAENGSIVENGGGSNSLNGDCSSGFSRSMYDPHGNRKDVDDDVPEKDACRCGCFASLLNCCGCGARQENKLLQDPLSSPPRSPGFCDSCCCCHWVRRLLRFVNIFSEDVPWVTQVFCALNFIAGILVLLATCTIIIAVVSTSHRTNVNDGSACQNYVIDELLTPDLAFSIVYFFLNGIISLVLSLFAVRFENKGLLMCHCLSVVLQLSRVIYFVLTMNSDYLAGPVKVFVELFLCIHSVLLLISCCMYGSVSHSFGWRTFKKGITQPLMLRRRNRQMYLKSCVYIDILGTLNACVALLSIVALGSEHTIAIVLTGISITMSLLFAPLIRRRATWYVILFAVVAAASLTFYFYAVSSLVSPYFIRKVDKHFAESECYRTRLYNCLGKRDVCIVTSMPGSMERRVGGQIVNDTDTYVPTSGANKEYFLIHDCDEECFSEKGDALMQYIEGCCKEYAHCRLHDAVRIYGGVYLALLSIVAIVVRVTLIILALRTINDTQEEETRSSCSATLGIFHPHNGNTCAADHLQETLPQINSSKTENKIEDHSVESPREGLRAASAS